MWFEREVARATSEWMDSCMLVFLKISAGPKRKSTQWFQTQSFALAAKCFKSLINLITMYVRISFAPKMSRIGTGKWLHIPSQRLRQTKIAMNSVFRSSRSASELMFSTCAKLEPQRLKKKGLRMSRPAFCKKLILVGAVVLHPSSRSRAADPQSQGGGWGSHSVDPPSKTQARLMSN